MTTTPWWITTDRALAIMRAAEFSDMLYRRERRAEVPRLTVLRTLNTRTESRGRFALAAFDAARRDYAKESS